jgi:hypothetical protein
LDELLARATQGVDPDAPGAYWRIVFNLLNMMPWAAMFWWSLLFVLVGALLGWWRGRLLEGIVWAAVLGPVGWVVVIAGKPCPGARAKPPPLRR